MNRWRRDLGAGARLPALMRLSPLTIAGSAVAAVLLATAAFLAGLWGQAGSEAGLFRPHDAARVARGAELYRQYCAACHGAELEGETPDWRSRDEEGFLPGPPHDETGHTWHHPDQVLFDITKYGLAEAANLPDYRTRMPAFADVLDDGEIIAIFSFIKSRTDRHSAAGEGQMNDEGVFLPSIMPCGVL